MSTTTDINELGLTRYRVRPLDREDARAVYELMAAAELHDTGEVAIEEADIVGDWQRPKFDIETQSIGILDGERLVAYAEVYAARRCEATVHPDHRGRGIGTALAEWGQRVARRDGGSLVGQTVPVGSDAEDLFRALGYDTHWTSWVLELPEGSTIEPQPLPEGYAVRAAIDEADFRAAHEVIEDAFLEWSARDRDSYADFAANVVDRPGFEPWQLRLVDDPDGVVVGAAFVIGGDGTGYVDKLAVRRDERGKGLARALLVDAFETARTHGATRSELSTDSRTGALGLYQRVGMRVRAEWRHWAIDTSDQM